ncbi:ras association domain-containing protein 2b [Tachysurus vachellii]|uniref:ras association domain-containing protein 2b n=1 Tax=Tachysurus vachellii TaxID=175792 RepID=UPI00296B02B8|nr:ras association domain-containing protein 2b [Tachysurus vachellii]XP_060752325.1 ras association domain-containing protein 2b [Tachysurus vachellii]
MAVVNSVQIGENKFISKTDLLSHLKTYNLYFEETSLQLRHREEEEELIIEGLLNIFWGLRRPIRLQMQDGKEPITSPRFLASLRRSRPDGNKAESKKQQSTQAPPTIMFTEPGDDSNESGSEAAGDRGEEEDSSLQRTRSCVSGRTLGVRPEHSKQRQIKRHRCSFNGHFYNHTTAVFTPAFGSVTNVRVNSSMTTLQVLRVLLNKFKIENSPDEFALFFLHTSGERVQLKKDDHPLAIRILHGPCEQISKIFLMEPDQVEEVTYDVAQYIKLEMPVLQSFIVKLKEEENREMEKLKQKYCEVRRMIQKHMQRLSETTFC